MKRSIISLSFAALVTAGLAAAQSASTDEGRLDRTLPTYPELGFDGWRNESGDSEMNNRVQVQLASDGYRNEAGESEMDNRVQVQIASDGYRNEAGESEIGNRVQVQIASDGYRFNAGESTHDLVVQDVG